MKINNIRKIGFSLILILLFTQACQVITPESVKPETKPIEPTVELIEPTATTETIISPTQTEPPEVEPINSIGDSFSPELGSSSYDVQNYIIQIKLDPALTNYLEAVVEIQAISLEDSLSEMSLDFIGFDIASIQVNGEDIDYSRNGDKLNIQLPHIISSGESFQVRIGYSGNIVLRPSRYVTFEDSVGMIFPSDESILIASEPDGARFWLPCNDHPRDKALFRIEITAPENYLAASNGRLIETEELSDGQIKYIWEHNYPMATYLATIVVGDYERYEQVTSGGILIRDYIFPETKELAFAAFANTSEMLSWLESLLGPYPFDTYGHATVDIGGFSLETQSLVMMSNEMLGEDVVIHEMVHMWFGDWVSLDSWGEMWRNEGFATYLSWYWFFKDDSVGFNRLMQNRINEVQSAGNLEPLGDLTPNNLFSYETYIKGGVMVHALREEVGDEAFFAGLKLYFERYGGGTASDLEFQQVMEEASGTSLLKFFGQWLN